MPGLRGLCASRVVIYDFSNIRVCFYDSLLFDKRKRIKEKDIIKAIPNFDAKKFKYITGIDVNDD